MLRREGFSHIKRSSPTSAALSAVLAIEFSALTMTALLKTSSSVTHDFETLSSERYDKESILAVKEEQAVVVVVE